MNGMMVVHGNNEPVGNLNMLIKNHTAGWKIYEEPIQPGTKLYREFMAWYKAR